MAINLCTNTSDECLFYEVLSHTNMLTYAHDALRFYNYITGKTCKELLQFVKENISPRELLSAEIPQFSSFVDCYITVPRLVVCSGIDNITFERIGSLMRTGKTSKMADCKYGENQSKTASLMGLVTIQGGMVYPNGLTLLTYNLNNSEWNFLLPKLCLLVPFVQQYFVRGANEETRDLLLGILSETTQARRKGNCMTMIKLVENACK